MNMDYKYPTNAAAQAVSDLVAEMLDAEVARSGPQRLSSIGLRAKGDTVSRLLESLTEGAEELDPDLWLYFMLRCTDRGPTIYSEIFAALDAVDTGASPAACAARADAYSRLGAAIVRQLLRSADHFLVDELRDHFHYQQAIRRYQINKQAEEMSNVR